MKKLIMIAIAILLPTIIFGQDDDQEIKEVSKLRLKSVYVGFGTYETHFTSNGNSALIDQYGITQTLGLSLAYKKHIFSFDTDFGQAVQIGVLLFGSNTEGVHYRSFDLLYGREFSLSSWFRVEAHIGLGLYVFKGRKSMLYDTSYYGFTESYVKKEVIGVPIDVKFMFDISERFAMGINPEVNLNSMNTTYRGDLIFQYKFN